MAGAAVDHPDPTCNYFTPLLVYASNESSPMDTGFVLLKLLEAGARIDARDMGGDSE